MSYNQGAQGNNPQNLQFYQSNYAYQQGQPGGVQGGAGNVSSMMGNLGSMDTSFGGNVSGDLGGPLAPGILAAFGTGGYPNEPPLLEELGINFQHIKMKSLVVLNPLNRNIPSDIMSDSDLAGPILFVLLFGMLLLLAGKVQFGYIYGLGLFGTISLHYLFKLMSNDVQLDILRSASVIGYCLLPLVILSAFGIFFNLDNLIGYVLSGISIFWCTYSASGFFVSVLKLHNVRALIAYPLSMFYIALALMAIFVEKPASSKSII